MRMSTSRSTLPNGNILEYYGDEYWDGAWYRDYRILRPDGSVLSTGRSKTPNQKPPPQSNTPQQTQSPPAQSAADQARAARAAQMASFTGWSNIPEVRALQQQWWSIYVETGKTDTPEQQALNAQAQNIRQLANPAYDPSKYPIGPSNPWEAGNIALPPSSSGAGAILQGASALWSSGIILIVALLLLGRR